MQTETILSSTWLSIIFENRNQEYGAYQLRKSYSEIIFNACCGVNIAFVLLMLVWLNLNIYDNNLGFQARSTEGEMKYLEMNLTPIKLPKNAKSESWKIEDEIVKEQMAKEELKRNLFLPSIKSNSFSDFQLIPDTTEAKVDVNAEYPGGWENMMSYLMKNIVYDDVMKQNGVDAMVIFKIKIADDGWVYKSPKYIKVVIGGDEYLNSEMVRLIQNMPQWKPAIKDHQKVKQWITIPVHIVLPSI